MRSSEITKLLAPEQQHQLVDQLLEGISSQENCLLLSQIYDELVDSELRAQIDSKVVAYFSENVAADYMNLEILSILVKSQQSMEKVFQIVESYLISQFKARLTFQFDAFAVELFTKHIDLDTVAASEDTNFNCGTILAFLDKYFQMELDQAINKSLVIKLLCFLLVINDDEIASKCCSMLRWVSLTGNSHDKDSFQHFVWEFIPTVMQSSTNPLHVSNVYILWLRYLVELKSTGSSVPLDSVIKQNCYWKFIQDGLISDVHEHRKYALSILKLSVQYLQFDVKNEFIDFEVSNKDQLTNDWKKFSTLFEIMGIDTALNQAEAAKQDILGFLSCSSSSSLPSSWGIALLSTAFKASMEGVRKFGLNLMYSVPKQDLPIFANESLTKVFLKLAVEAPLFQVAKSSENNTLSSEYAVKLENFIKNLLSSLKNDKDELVRVCELLLDFLVDIKSTFGPARIFISLGLLKGLKGKEIFNSSQLPKLIQLFESSAEDEVFQKTIQTIHLRLLLNFEGYDRKAMVNALTTFIKINGYDIYNENLEFVIDYFVKNFDLQDAEGAQEEEAAVSVDEQVVIYSIYQQAPSIITDEFLKELASSKLEFKDFSKEFINLLTLLVEADVKEEEAKYANSCDLLDLKIFENSWNSIDLSKLLNSVLNEFEFNKFEFFVKIYSKCCSNSFNSVIEYNHILKFNQEIVSLINQNDYKLKDYISSVFLNLILSFLKSTIISPNELKILTQLILKHVKFSWFKNIISICDIIETLLSKYFLLNKSEDNILIIDLFDIAENLWEFVNSERLILNQKSMHLTLISTIFNEFFLIEAINNEYLSKRLKKIGLQIIAHSYSKRSFLPAFTKRLLSFALGYGTEFEQSFWLIELILKSFVQPQDDSNSFRMKILIAHIFDKQLKFYGDLYKEVYGDEEISAKINIISILTKKFSTNDFLNEYFKQVISNYNLLTPLKRIDGEEEQFRVAAFQTLLLITNDIDSSLLSKYAREDIINSLINESSPLVRTYMEWIISLNMMVNFVQDCDELFRYFHDQSKPSLITSIERVSYLIMKKLITKGTITTGTKEFEFINNFIDNLIVNCSSNKPLIRHFSNSLILSIYPDLTASSLSLPAMPILKLLHSEAKKSELTGQYRSGDAIVWDITDDLTLVGVCGGVLSRISPPQLRNNSIDLITSKEFDKYLARDTGRVLAIGQDPKELLCCAATKEKKSSGSSSTSSSSAPLQTKSGAWETVFSLEEQHKKVQRTELIVVSSLVDKPPNLGGICRLCDVLGAGLMTVDDIQVKKHPQFKNVAVTADHWMPIEQVRIDEIKDFMRQKKKQGYTLIGLEQTDRSIVLGPDTKFPSKSLILLGREAEGVPGDLLAELDYCIEIRQLGVIRSMNIQTATAVIVHAYSSAQFA